MIVAIPSEAPGGMNAALSAHFGHCAAFTLVEVEGDELGQVQVLPNAGHAQGNCLAPISVLQRAGVAALASGGMGMRPLLGFQQAGIAVFHTGEARTVAEAIELIRTRRARQFGPAEVCGGHGGAHGGDHGGGCQRR